jgi:uncharacterized membrane protein HdeD (DUF308 family)
MELITNIFLDHSPGWLIGQAFGIVAIILGFVTYQMKTQKSILFVQSCVAVAFCAHYFFLGAFSAMAMNAVNIVRNFLYDKRAKKGSTSRVLPIAFVVIQCVACILTWEAWYSVFVLLGIGINTYCMSLYDPQKVRKSIFVTSPLVFTYDIFAGAIGGSIYETVAWVSAIIGVIKYRKKK